MNNKEKAILALGAVAGFFLLTRKAGASGLLVEDPVVIVYPPPLPLGDERTAVCTYIQPNLNVVRGSVTVTYTDTGEKIYMQTARSICKAYTSGTNITIVANARIGYVFDRMEYGWVDRTTEQKIENIVHTSSILNLTPVSPTSEGWTQVDVYFGVPTP